MVWSLEDYQNLSNSPIPRYKESKPTDMQYIGKAFEKIGRKVFLVAGDNKIMMSVDDNVKLAFDLKGKYLPKG